MIIPPKNTDWNEFDQQQHDIGYCLFQSRDDQFLHGHMPILIISRRPLERGKKASESLAINMLGYKDDELARAFDVIISGIRQDDWNSILDQLPASEPDIPEYMRWKGHLNQIIQIKPSLFGIGLNLNAAIDKAGEALLKNRQTKKWFRSRIVR